MVQGVQDDINADPRIEGPGGSGRAIPPWFFWTIVDLVFAAFTHPNIVNLNRYCRPAVIVDRNRVRLHPGIRLAVNRARVLLGRAEASLERQITQLAELHRNVECLLACLQPPQSSSPSLGPRAALPSSSVVCSPPSILGRFVFV